MNILNGKYLALMQVLLVIPIRKVRNIQSAWVEQAYASESLKEKFDLKRQQQVYEGRLNGRYFL